VSETFNKVAKQFGVPASDSEYVFAAPRKWRFDYAWPASRVALEVEGGVWTNGRHTRGAGFLKDVEKYNAAAVRGWLVLRCTPATLFAEATFQSIRLAIAANHAKLVSA
jgi:hypothetical protein